MAITYKDAGVDIDAGDSLVKRLRPLAASTRRPEVLSGLGGFAGLCALPSGYRDPVLVSGTDGVGTKLKIAFATGKHDTIGIDLVAMAVNDIAVTGAEPLFFLDYFGTGKLDVDVGEAVVSGIAEGCRQAGCALIGGETAELPTLYADGEYDLAGFAVGVAERDEIRTGENLVAGDVLIGLTSDGLHSNGFSLARRALLDHAEMSLDDTPAELAGKTLGEELLTPTRIYVSALAAAPQFKAAAHITGGGLIENPPRMLASDDLAVVLRSSSWPIPPVFELIARAGVEESEMRRTFNMGLGMVVVVAESDADVATRAMTDAGYRAHHVGHIERRNGEPVRFV